MAARILVADDSVTIQKVVELTFSKEDFVLVQARSGEEAIRKAKEERPDLVLLDLVMPDKNGYEVCAALRAEPMLRSVPIILLTGTFETFDKGKGIQVGANDFVTKPFESQVLISKVKQLLFAKTVEMAPTAAPAGAGKAVPPKEVPRPAPTTVAPPPPRIPPQPSPASGLPRGVAPGIMRGVAPPSPAPTSPPRTVVAPAGSSVTPPPSFAAPVPPRAAQPSAVLPTRAPTMAAVPPERPVPPPLSVSPSMARTLDLSPPSEEISQDRVRSVVEPPSNLPPPPAPGEFSELSLEDLTTLPLPEELDQPGDLHVELEKAASGPAAVPEDRSVEMPSLAPQTNQTEKAPPFREVGAAALPKDLSLEDLLSAEGTAAPLETQPAPAPLEDLPGGPVFDLTSELGGPSLPLVEVGTGEPPALSIEDLLASAEAAPHPPAEVGALEPSAPDSETPVDEVTGGRIFELTSTQETPPFPPVEAREEESRALSAENLMPREETPPAQEGMLGLQELELELTSGPPAGAPAREPAPPAAPPLDLGALSAAPVSAPKSVNLDAVLAEGEAPEPPQEVPPSEVPPSGPAMEAGAMVEDIPAAALTPPEMVTAPPIGTMLPPMEAISPVAAAMPPASRVEALVPEMAAMRQEVTEQVAHELAHDLSDKLLERIERIVWEVVPDLAEVLITKEIERIRSQAEGKQSS